VNAWVDEAWDPGISLREWWNRLAAAGYSQPSWPLGLGGIGADGRTTRLIADTLRSRDVIAAPAGIAVNMGGPTVLEHGTEHQRRLLWAIASGEQAWCQLFSEPGAGSDLASASTRAVPDGDGFVLTGQKVWNSAADIADRGILLARTDPLATKHAGLTVVLIDMEQPAIDVRPLRTMNGNIQLCEVFLDAATARAADVIGAVGGGWKVASTVLGHERRTASSGSTRSPSHVAAGRRGGQLERTVGDLIEEVRARRAVKPAAMITSVRSIIELARERGAASDPARRDAIASYQVRSDVYRLTNERARVAAASGRAPGSAASVAKLGLSGMARASRDLGLSVVGADGMLVGPDCASHGRVQHAALSAPGVSLGGGTDEIQRNVIAERVLGLPREPSGQ
jgi:alkylation response protein AidB-like acyl-CoA dehydrogenase